jgi:hypothetical protein
MEDENFSIHGLARAKEILSVCGWFHFGRLGNTVTGRKF